MSTGRLRIHAIRPQTAAYIAAMTTRPADDEILAIDSAIRLIVDTGAFAKLDGLYFLASATDQASRINIINPGTYNLTKINSPRFTANAGWDANGGAGYLDTGFNPSTAGGKFTQNSACIGIAVSVAAQTNPVFGNIGTGSSFLTARSAGDTFACRLNSVGSNNVASSSNGFFAASRASSTTVRGFKNANQVISATNATITPPSASLGILSDNGGARYALGTTVTFAFMGANLTGRQMLAMYQAYQILANYYG